MSTPTKAAELAQWLYEYAGEVYESGIDNESPSRIRDGEKLIAIHRELVRLAQVEAAAGAIDWMQANEVDVHCDFQGRWTIWFSGNQLQGLPSLRHAIAAAMSAQPTPGKAGA